MINPHGSDQLKPLFVMDEAERAELEREARSLPAITISSAAAANAVMLGSGYFTPLEGFMNRVDALRVARDMRTVDGLFWPVPVLNMVADPGMIRAGDRISLKDPNVAGEPVLAIQTVSAVESLGQAEKNEIALKVFRTNDMEHPGVAAFMSQGNHIISGPIQVLNFSYFATDFPETFRTAWQIREEMRNLGWETVVAFQTRNPMHRAHEELCRMAKEAVNADGILIHMLLGKLKKGDIPADVRDASIRKMVELYFPPDTVLITGYGFDMLYAGPREAVLHAIFRQNCGCTHLIVGRDHAGCGNYYGPFDAQAVFDDEVPAGALEIKIFKADHTAWSRKLNKVVMMGQHPDHTKEDWVLLSGTRVREMLSRGEKLPEEFSRPEVAEILGGYYRSLGEER
ncbi:MAG: sulfate adenylyltransferase [Acidobacteriota bacterium]|jgi:sulfate adenylyltransferase|nr:sulfate adenylyltransferase [Acidobacteriota bacterium]